MNNLKMSLINYQISLLIM